MLREAHLRSILATVPDAMIVIDKRGCIVSFSAAAERMFGYSEQELIATNIKHLMPSPDQERHDGYLARYMETHERRIIGIGRITTARHRDGWTFPVELSIGEAEIDGEAVFTGFIRDLTERRQSERRVHDLQRELAHVSRDTAIGTLASALAHELNQPLTALANYLEGARDLLDSTDPKAKEIIREALSKAATQAIRAGQIVHRLRDFVSRGDTERQIESLSKLILEANALALLGKGAGGIEVEVSLDPGQDLVLVDRVQIQQVLLNVIRNAIEAMVDSPVRKLAITTCKVPDGHVEIAVADSGAGLSPEVSDHLFEPLFSTKTAGLGVGLSICRTIVEAHGGRIWAGPSPLGGTALHFTLPDGGGEHDEAG
jgi:two-component system sensor kinase FixL